jgi:hypothetical protein
MELSEIVKDFSTVDLKGNEDTILRSVDDQDVGETVVIRFRCVSQRIEKFGGSHEGKVKRHPVTSATVARVRIDDERASPDSHHSETLFHR